MYNHMELLTIRAYFSATENGRLPRYLGSTLRGILGHCLRKMVCDRPSIRCHLCDVAVDCAYANSFNSPGNEAGAVNPFVLYAPISDKEMWYAGDSCMFDMTIIGRATRLAGFYLDGLQAMSERGWGAGRMRFALNQVVNVETGALIWSGGKTWLRNMRPSPLQPHSRAADSILVRFQTPTRVLVKRELCRKLTFADLIQSIGRRIALLSHAYAGQRMDWDEEQMLEQARQVRTVEESWRFVDFERYSMTHDHKLSLPAIEGWARYEGDLTPFTALLEAGRLLHVGKNATHGFGHYDVFYG